MGDWPPMQTTPGRQEKEKTYLTLVDMFVDVVEPEIIQMVLQNRNWDLDAALEDIMILSNTPHSDKARSVKNNISSKTTGLSQTREAKYSNIQGSNLQNASLPSNSSMAVEFEKMIDLSQDGVGKRNGKKSKSQDHNKTPNSKTATDLKKNSQINMAPFLEQYNYVKRIRGAYDRCLMLIKDGVKLMVILRGPPGSGKSYLAQKILTESGIDPAVHKSHIFSSDDFFVRKNVYVYVPDQLSQAHMWNQHNVVTAIREEVSPIIIDNTNTQAWEMRVYAEAAVSGGYDIEILEPSTWWFAKVNELTKRNTHGVPKAKIRSMIDRYEMNITPQYLLQQFELRYSLSSVPPQPTRNTKWKDKLSSQRNNKPKKKKELSSQSNLVNFNEMMTSFWESTDMMKIPSVKSTFPLQNENVQNLTMAETPVNESQVTIQTDLLKPLNGELGCEEYFNGGNGSQTLPGNLISFEDIQKDYQTNLLLKKNTKVMEPIPLPFPTTSSLELNVPTAFSSTIYAAEMQETSSSINNRSSASSNNFDFMAETNKLLAALSKSTVSNKKEETLTLEKVPKLPEEDRISADNKMNVSQNDKQNHMSESNDTSSSTSVSSETFEEKITNARELVDSIIVKAIDGTEEGKTQKPYEADEIKVDFSSKQEFFAGTVINDKSISVEKNVTFNHLSIGQKDAALLESISEEGTKPLSSQYQLRDIDIQERFTALLSNFKTDSAQNNEEINQEIKSYNTQYQLKDVDIQDRFTTLLNDFVEDLAQEKNERISDYNRNVNSQSGFTFVQNDQEDMEKTSLQDKSDTLYFSNASEETKEKWVTFKTAENSVTPEQMLHNSYEIFPLEKNTGDSTGTSSTDVLPCNESDIDSLGKTNATVLIVKDSSNTVQPLWENSFPGHQACDLDNRSEEKDKLDTDLHKNQHSDSFNDWENENSAWDSECKKITNSEAPHPKPARNLSRPRFLTSTVSTLQPSNNESVFSVESWDTVSNPKENWNNIESVLKTSASRNEMAILPQRSRLNNKQSVDSSTNTSYLDVICDDEEIPNGMKILKCNPRNIITDKCNEVKSLVTETLYLDKGTMTHENPSDSVKSFDINQITSLFPHIPEKYILDVVEKCQGDIDWAVDLLLDSEHSFYPFSEEAGSSSVHNEDNFRTKEYPAIQTETYKCVQGKSSPKRESRISNTQEHAELKRTIENSVVIGKEHYSDKILKVIKKKHPEYVSLIENDQAKQENVLVEPVQNNDLCKNQKEMNTNLEDNNDDTESTSSGCSKSSSGSENEDNTVELILNDDLILQLQQKFGNPNLPGEMNSSPVVKLPVSLARQLYGYIMDSLQTDIDEQQNVIENMIAQDEEVAKLLQYQEENSLRIPHLQEIMDMEVALAVHKADQEEWKEKSRDTVAARLSKNILLEKFPHVDPIMLTDLLHIHNFSLHDTIASLHLALGVKEGTRESTSPTRHGQTKEARTTFIMVSGQGKDDTDTEDVLSEAQTHRDNAASYYSLRMECLNKAHEAFRSGNKPVATYYSQLAEAHKNKVEQCNLRAAACLLANHKSGTDTLDLHFLHVTEAEVVLDMFLDEAISRLGERGRTHQRVFLITGRGLRSHGGISRIKPMVQRKLAARSIVFSEINPGMLSALVRTSTPLSHSS
uniref:Smr domain-containing protein n=1 Tax=Cuerna arida TaxID=1464854 RepID=A0A1B6FC02_9HEMI